MAMAMNPFPDMKNFSTAIRAAVFTALIFGSATKILSQAGAGKTPDLDLGKLGGKWPIGIRQDPPNYPYAMSRAGLIGQVAVEFIIDQRGVVQNPYVIESNNPWFERAAIDAILKWKFKPGELAGRPVDVRVKQLIVFELDYGGSQPKLWQVVKGKNFNTLPLELQWDIPPEPVQTLFPVYPFEQLKAGIKGRAKVGYVVGPDGRVVSAKLQEATTPELGLALLAMIDAWRFKPARKKDGTPCYAGLGSEYEFTPNGRGEVPVSDTALKILRNLEKKPEAIMTLKDLDVPLKPRSRRPPVYPTALKEAGQDGLAEIEFFVDQNGDAQLPRIVSSTATEFGYAAALAVATWRFEVPRKKGKAVVVRARIPIEFS